MYAARDTVVPARGKVLVDTDISMAVPAGTCTIPPPLLFLHLLPVFFYCLYIAAVLHIANLTTNLDGRIAPRSGLASKHMIDTGAGVIDADYRGQVKVLLFNHGEKDFEVKEGDRVAQLVLERIYTPEVKEVQELEDSVRGAGGFGSTG